MRWTNKTEEAPKVGDTRTVTTFLLLPKKVKKETRWMENVTINQEYQEIEEWEFVDFGGGNQKKSYNEWVDLEFVDAKDEVVEEVVTKEEDAS
jgi:hypothetical protein